MCTSTSACCRAASARGSPSPACCSARPTSCCSTSRRTISIDALVDYGGTPIFVSHDRYFVERLATRIVEIGAGDAQIYPGTYKEFLWHKAHGEREGQDGQGGRVGQDGQGGRVGQGGRGKHEGREQKKAPDRPTTPSHEDRKRLDADARKRQRAARARQAEIEALEQQIAACEASLREIEQTMAAPGFYGDRAAAQPVIDRHQALMWQVGDLMHQWEKLQSASDLAQA